MNFKDFFYFTKGQRVGIAVLIVLIAVAVLLNAFLPRIVSRDKIGFNAQFNDEVSQFRQSLLSIDSIREAQWQQAYEARYRQNYANWNNSKTYSKSDTYTLFAFDPNTLDSIGFVRLGVKSWLTSNILKYRQKGGKFHQKSDFAKIYGLTEEKFKELESYINISEQKDEI
ncbi:MAG: helix-hairpin-helix domain-containing protein, partial [Prevotellaceae bacterium]|nr:helix-hairpin-helix domain-containing protein [Prevotellaceae bacterium]